jgi:hypothetical protein
MCRFKHNISCACVCVARVYVRAAFLMCILSVVYGNSSRSVGHVGDFCINFCARKFKFCFESIVSERNPKYSPLKTDAESPSLPTNSVY